MWNGLMASIGLMAILRQPQLFQLLAFLFKRQIRGRIRFIKLHGFLFFSYELFNRLGKPCIFEPMRGISGDRLKTTRIIGIKVK